MDVSIILVNYNTEQLTINCLDSIYKFTHDLDFEIIVVDNNSSDDSVARIKTEFKDVIVIESPENLGFGRANNLAAKAAKGKYLFFLNTDTLLLNNAVKIFFDYAELNSNIGALGSYLLDEQGNFIHSYGQFITLKNFVYKYIPAFRFKEKFENSDYKFVDYITGADLFIPKTVIDETGAFDPDYFMYCEEVDLQYRICKAGYDRIVINGPQIIHLEGGSFDTSKQSITKREKRAVEIHRSRVIYSRKHNSYFTHVIFRVIFFTRKLLAAIRG